MNTCDVAAQCSVGFVTPRDVFEPTPCNSILIMKLLLMLALCSTTAYGQEIGIVFSSTFLHEIGSTDSGVGTGPAAGIGGRFVYRALPHLDFESELTVWPNNPATSGRWVQGLFGAKIGQRFDRFGAFAKVRPGFGLK